MKRKKGCGEGVSFISTTRWLGFQDFTQKQFHDKTEMCECEWVETRMYGYLGIQSLKKLYIC